MFDFRLSLLPWMRKRENPRFLRMGQFLKYVGVSPAYRLKSNIQINVRRDSVIITTTLRNQNGLCCCVISWSCCTKASTDTEVMS